MADGGVGIFVTFAQSITFGSIVSLPDQSPKPRKGHKTSDYNSIVVKFRQFCDILEEYSGVIMLSTSLSQLFSALYAPKRLGYPLGDYWTNKNAFLSGV